MIGHGDLAERSIAPVMPESEAFPYTTRVSAEVSVCLELVGGGNGGEKRKGRGGYVWHAVAV